MNSNALKFMLVAPGLIAVLMLCGCPSPKSQMTDVDAMVKQITVAVPAFLTIKEGMSLDALKIELGVAARQQFTVSTANGTFTMIECAFSGGDNTIYLIFRDKILLKIVNPLLPDANTPSAAKSETASTNLPGIKNVHVMFDAIGTEHITSAIDAPAMTHDQIADYLKPYAELHHGNMPAPLLYAFAAATASRTKTNLHETIKFLQQYDGGRASLGMNAAEIEKLYGQPLRTIKANDDLTVWIYQNTHTMDIGYPLAFVGLGIVYDPSGHVSAIYSDAFFPEEWKG